MTKPDPKNLPMYAKYLVKNIHRTVIRIEVEKILESDARGFNQSLYALPYYLKKELKEQRIKLD